MASSQAPEPPTVGQSSFPIVGIGASAGGLYAFKTLLSATPADAGMAFVLIQHLDPTHDSLMVDLLSKCTAMPVLQAEEGMPVAVNHVYIIPPNQYLSIHQGVLRLMEFSERRGVRVTIDTFLRSLAQDQQERAVGIILTGTGTDGTAGLKEIKAAGGLTLVQDPDTATHDGMPRSAMMTGLADLVCPVEQMADVLVRFADHPYVSTVHHQEAGREAERGSSNDVSAVLTLLRARRGLDFHHYKPNTLVRRIERRMGLKHLEKTSDYLALLRDHPDELERLSRDLMIGVTSFFRDPQAFAELEKQVIEPLVRETDDHETLRVWVPGCSTGEEAYSIAILIAEQLASQGKNGLVQVFASDIDSNALDIARAGRYPVGIAADLSPERVKRHFDPCGDDHLIVNKALREMVVFARHNLIVDPPFSKLDLISCRNLMIYLQLSVQNQLIRLFYFALRSGGYVFLGGSESTGNHHDLFATVSKKSRIYRRLDGPSPQELDLPTALADPARTAARRRSRPALRPQLVELAQRWVLDEYAPATVIVNRRFEPLFFCGDTERFLKIPHGKPNLNLLDIVREGLVTRISGAVYRALDDNVPVHIERCRMRRDARYILVSLRVKPLKDAPGGGDGLAMVSFHEMQQPPALRLEGDDSSAAGNDALTQQLADELKMTKEDLHSTTEEMKASNEELRASNEEVMSMNEELQATNDELESSKEELQSLNEELITVNSQLQEKLEELESVNNDVTNFLNSCEMSILFLDRELRIKRFTPTSTRLFKMIPSDTGRPLTDIAQAFDDPELLADARQVLDQQTLADRLIQDHTGHWYGRRILPYHTQDEQIDGVVILFDDITRLRQSERDASERLAQLESVYDQAPVGLAFHDRNLRMKRVNVLLAELNGVAPHDQINKTPAEFLPAALAKRVEQMLRQVLDSGIAATNVELHSELPSQPGVMRDWLASYYPVYAKSRELLGVNVMVQEITERKRIERRLVADRVAAKVLATARSTEIAIPLLLQRLATCLDFEVCEFWQPEKGGLRCSERVNSLAKTEDGGVILQRFQRSSLGTNDGLIGRVWVERQARWLLDVGADAQFERAAEAAQLGLCTGFAFPVASSEQALGVVSLFSRARLPEDGALVETMTKIGRELCNFNRRTQAEAQLRSDDQRKGEFLSVLGHELRNPLASINSAVRLLQQDGGEREWALATMASNVVTMGRLLDDLLDLSRINSGKINLRPETLAVETLFDRALSAVRGRLEQERQRLSVEPPSEPLCLFADPTRLEQVLVNLLINASKYTSPGGKIGISCVRDEDFAVITVSDSGDGIDADSLTAIFEPFAQLDNPKRQNNGLGIGLALVKQLTELHGGTINAHSEGLGKGARFILRLPLAGASGRIEADPPQQVSVGPPRGASTAAIAVGKPRVLLVDDNESATRGLALLLETWGYDVKMALDGSAAQNIAASHQPQVFILDLNLPDVSGYELARQLREDGFAQALLIALSGFGDEAAKTDALAAGFDHHLNKPADLDALRRLLPPAPLLN